MTGTDKPSPTRSEPDGQRRTYLRESLLLLGFVLLLAAAVFTVVVPELAEEPEPEPQSTTAE